MVKKTIKKELESEPVLTLPLQDAQQRISEQISSGKTLLNPPSSTWTQQNLEDRKNEYYTWDEYNFTLISKLFTSSTNILNDYRDFFPSSKTFYNLEAAVQDFTENVQSKIRRLESILKRLPLFVPLTTEFSTPSNIVHSRQQATNQVFVVHGADEAAKQTVARFIGHLQLEPVILHEKANEGKTIIEKFESNSDVSFAVVLFTPDDIGYPSSNPQDVRQRARQNVIFELGYFLAKLGRNKVCALYSPNVDIPSDFQGVAFVRFEGDGWKLQLAREMKTAGLTVDLNDIA